MTMVICQRFVINPGIAIQSDDRMPDLMRLIFPIDSTGITCLSDPVETTLYGMKRWRYCSDTGFVGNTIEAVNHGFVRRRNFFRRIIRAIDLLPNSFSIAKKWNIRDHDRRVRDGSITYDRFDVDKDRIEYRISGCMYVKMFEAYGIRSLCKIFCMTDTTSYENLRRHVTFIRHSDLSDGDACHDEIIRRRKSQ